MPTLFICPRALDQQEARRQGGATLDPSTRDGAVGAPQGFGRVAGWLATRHSLRGSSCSFSGCMCSIERSLHVNFEPDVQRLSQLSTLP
jgi:hypothetical protein